MSPQPGPLAHPPAKQQHTQTDPKGKTLHMGATLATAAITRWPHLSDRARLVLVTMCLQARDRASGNTPAATYYGGHEDLAMKVFGADEPTDADLRKVTLAVRELRQAGAVVVAQPACRGRTTVYRLDVTGLPNQDSLI